MNLRERLAAFASVPLSGFFMTDKGGSDSQAHREMGRKAKHGGNAPTPRSVSGGAAKRAGARELQAGGSRPAVVRTGPEGKAQAKRAPMPEWLRERHAAETKARHRRALVEAERVGKPVGLVLDEQTKAVLADARRGSISEATMSAYRRDVARLVERGQTPAEAANSAKHWSRLRAAWLAVEVDAIREARASAERYRKAGDLDRAKARTLEAWTRATALDMDFLQPGAPRWADRKAQLKAEGKKPARKSKRYGPQAPTAEGLLLALDNVRGARQRHEHRAAVLALFGVRPEELRKGVELKVHKGALVARVKGAKVDGQRGHGERLCALPIPKRESMNGAAVAWLADCVKEAGGTLKIESTDADIQSLNHTLGRLVPGLSCYSFRHATGSDLKAAVEAGEVSQEQAAAFMGHRSEKSLSYYGRASKGRKGRRFRAAVARDIEPPKKAPITRTQKAKARKAKADGGRVERLPARSKVQANNWKPAPASPAPRARGPRGPR